MDTSDILKTAGLSSTVVAIGIIALKIAQYICTHKVRSKCCNRNLDFGFQVSESVDSPVDKALITPPESKTIP